MSSPFFSVIIPVFNRENLVERAIKSVLRQSFKDFELILVDDGSTDNTWNVLNKYESEFCTLLKNTNQGVSKARNSAALKSTGNYLCFLDSDDEWLENKLELQYQYLQTHSETKILHGEEIWIRNGKRVNPKLKHQKGGGDQFIPSLDLCLISPSTVCLERCSFVELGMFREDYLVCEDYDLWLKYTARYSVGFITEPLIIKYGGHDDQLSAKYHSMDMYRIKSLVYLYDNFQLSHDRLDSLLRVLKSKIEILSIGLVKHKRHQELKELEVLTSHVKFSSS